MCPEMTHIISTHSTQARTCHMALLTHKGLGDPALERRAASRRGLYPNRGHTFLWKLSNIILRYKLQINKRNIEMNNTNANSVVETNSECNPNCWSSLFKVTLCIWGKYLNVYTTVENMSTFYEYCMCSCKYAYYI